VPHAEAGHKLHHVVGELYHSYFPLRTWGFPVASRLPVVDSVSGG
jgi:hypothetical protein